MGEVSMSSKRTFLWVQKLFGELHRPLGGTGMGDLLSTFGDGPNAIGQQCKMVQRHLCMAGS